MREICGGKVVHPTGKTAQNRRRWPAGVLAPMLSMAALMAGAPMANAAEAEMGPPPRQEEAPPPPVTYKIGIADVIKASPARDWRPLDPANTLYMEMPNGRVVIELAPPFAPRHIENIKTLVREH